ncbi:DUF5906 domain-containing protein [Methylobacterium sp. J-072]|uniref:DUF5906 domain-containing protein n=1 Tax=Methylobacterium sp. J-072 TaxID=2836651 RepID=UPI001FBAD8A1|nr:DUF5906 domain-containing protein [Methylobacterium sp. J-072]MCJ2093210.1 DUF5906 domain-containing protein [Methylobacterium sp. J-072]
MNAHTKSMPSFGAATRPFTDAGIPEEALIPIAPHDAEIFGKGGLNPKNLGKAPGKFLPHKRAWCGLANNSEGARYIHEGATAQDVRERADWPTPNVGVLGRHFPAIDSDAASDHARTLVWGALERAFGRGVLVAERLRGELPRRLYAFECTDPDDPDARVQNWSLYYWLPTDPEGDFPHGLDVIGQGKQFVATGIHPSGSPYRWDRDYDLCDLYGAGELARTDNAGMREFRAVLVEMIEAAGGQVQEGRPGGGGGELRDYSADEPVMAVGAVFRGLESIPNTQANFPSREDLVSVLAKIRAALGVEAEANRDRVEDWATRDGWADAEYFDKAWDSLDRGVRQASRDALELFFREHGVFEGARHDFREPISERNQQNIETNKKEAKEQRTRAETYLAEFGKKYLVGQVNLATNNPVCEIRRKAKPEKAVRGLDLWMHRVDWTDISTVEKLRATGCYQPNDNGFWSMLRDLKKVSPKSFFNGETLHPNYDRGEIVVEINPDGTTTQKLNLRYQSQTIRHARNQAADPRQAREDTETMLEFIRRVFGELVDYELDTLAYMVKTGRRPGNLLFLVGESGVGKSTYVLMLRTMFDGIGRNTGGQINGNALVNDGARRFALAGIEGCRIISVRELPEGASPTAMAQITSILKQFVDISGDADFVPIEKKGKDSQTVENFGRFVIASNYETSLKVEKNDRRILYARCGITIENKPSQAYYDRVNAVIEAPERLAAFYRYLRDERDIRGYNPAKAPPVSNAKLQAQILDLPNSAERHFAAAFELLVSSGREIFDLREFASLASDMSDNECRNSDGKVDDRKRYDLRAPTGQEQAALQYFASRATKLKSFKSPDGKSRLPTIYVINGTVAAKRVVLPDRREVLSVLERDRDRPWRSAQHPLPAFAYPLTSEDDGDGW